MNAAYVLLTTAWLAGQDPAPKAVAPAPAPAAPAVIAPHAHGAVIANGSCCGGGCDACCNVCDDCGKQSLFSRLRDRFRRKNDCCDTCDTCNTCAPVTITCGSACGTCDACDDCGKQSLFSRLRDRFRRKNDCCDTCDTCNSCNSCGTIAAPYAGHGAPIAAPAAPAAPKEQIKVMPKPSEPPQAPMPKDAKSSSLLIPAPVAPAAGLSVEETRSPFEPSRRHDSRVAHAADYSWVTGQLYFVHADGGLWLLRYAPVTQEDPHGGSVVLARDLSLDSYREGDLVTVRGQILNEHGSKFLGGPLYRASSIQLIERPAR